MLKKLFGALLTAATVCMAAPAYSQDYPTRPVKIVVPFGAGGITDLYARMVADRLKIAFNQPFVVENRPGQGGSFGPASVAKADPDGYTLLLGGSGNVIGESLYKNLPFSLLKDFVPVARGASAVNVLFVNANVKANTVAELVALAKAQPNKLTYASSGHGGIYHLAMEMFKNMTGTSILHIPYRTETAGRTDVISGQVNMMISAYGVTAPAIEAGQVRAIALTSAARFPRAPKIPTLAESGLPGYEGDAWVGLLAPTGTPAGAISKINAEVSKMQKDPEFVAKLGQAGLSPVEMTVDGFGAFLKADVTRWKKVIEVSGTTIQQ